MCLFSNIDIESRFDSSTKNGLLKTRCEIAIRLKL